MKLKQVTVNGSGIKTPNFKMFGDKDKFENMINLTDKPLTDCIEQYLKYKCSNKKKSSMGKYAMLKKHINAIQEQDEVVLYPVVIGASFMNTFDEYLNDYGLASNTIVNICAALKSIVKWSSLYGAKVADDLDDYKFKYQDAKPKLTLSPEEISRIYWFDINKIDVRRQKKNTLKKVRDQFVLSCFFGQRFSDSKRISESNFVGANKNIFKIVQLKTENKAVVELDKIFEEYPMLVSKILEEYNYNAPYSGDISNFNRYLKELFEYIGFNEELKFEYKTNGQIVEKSFKKSKLISSHCARRTFITNAVKRGIHTQQIKRASGHSSDTSFSKYVIWANT